MYTTPSDTIANRALEAVLMLRRSLLVQLSEDGTVSDSAKAEIADELAETDLELRELKELAGTAPVR